MQARLAAVPTFKSGWDPGKAWTPGPSVRAGMKGVVGRDWTWKLWPSRRRSRRDVAQALAQRARCRISDKPDRACELRGTEGGSVLCAGAHLVRSAIAGPPAIYLDTPES